MSILIRLTHRRSFTIAAIITLLTLSLSHFVPAEAASPRKVVVFLQGMCTSLDDSTSITTSTFGNLLASLNTKFNYKLTDFMVYSYGGGEMQYKNNIWQWRHYQYQEPWPFQQDVQTSVSKLHYQLTEYRKHYPDATFVLVGHSLGGYIAFQELMRNVTSSTYQKGLISKIITVDSPLQGAPSAFRTALQNQSALAYLKPCATGPMLQTLVDAYTNIHAQKAIFDFMFQDAIRIASERGVTLYNDGNLRDGLYDPTNCSVSIKGDVSTQWLNYPRVNILQFYLPYSLPTQCAVSHSAALKDANSVTLISRQIGIQN